MEIDSNPCNRREFFCLTSATVILSTIACRPNQSINHPPPSSEPLNKIRAFKDFPQLKDFLESMSEEAKHRIAAPTLTEMVVHNERFSVALTSDLLNLGYKLPEGKDFFDPIVLDRHFVENYEQVLFRESERMIYQVLDLKRLDQTVKKGSLAFGTFGSVERDIPLYEIIGVSFDSRETNISPINGTALRGDSYSAILLNFENLRGNASGARISEKDSVLKTLTNEVSHVVFRDYISKKYPTLDSQDLYVLQIDEAFSYYACIKNAPPNVVVDEVFGMLQAVLNGDLPFNYKTTGVYLAQALNAFLGKEDSSLNLKLHPEEYQRLIDSLVSDKEKTLNFRNFICEFFESRIHEDLTGLLKGEVRSYLKGDF